VARFASGDGGQLGDQGGLALAYSSQQGAVFIAQHLDQCAHGGEPNLVVTGLDFQLTLGNSQYAITDFVLRQDADGDGRGGWGRGGVGLVFMQMTF